MKRILATVLCLMFLSVSAFAEKVILSQPLNEINKNEAVRHHEAADIDEAIALYRSKAFDLVSVDIPILPDGSCDDFDDCQNALKSTCGIVEGTASDEMNRVVFKKETKECSGVCENGTWVIMSCTVAPDPQD